MSTRMKLLHEIEILESLEQILRLLNLLELHTPMTFKFTATTPAL
jgi:hypothetical protein